MNSSVPLCRYCSSSTEYGKLISPCKCRGSVKYVHSLCLQNWLSSSQIINSSLKHSKVYAFLCELCKSNIYFKIKYKHNYTRDIINYIINTLFKRKNLFKTGVYSFILFLFIRKLRSMILELIQTICIGHKLKSISQISKCFFSLMTISSFYSHVVNEYLKTNPFKRQFYLSFYENYPLENKEVDKCDHWQTD